MDHVLKKAHLELERTHTLVEIYRASGIKEIFFSLFWNSFKKALEKYAFKKEEILISYSNLHTDISKDAMNPSAKAIKPWVMRNNIMHITVAITQCWELLEHLIAHSHRQEEIVHHEKVFFVSLLESFNDDLHTWVWAHEKDFFGDITSKESVEWKNPLEKWKALLELQKERLKKHIDTISNK